MQVPCWTALTVHLVSGAVYPVFPQVRKWVEQQKVPGLRFARIWSVVLGTGLLLLISLWVLGKYDREIKWPLTNWNKGAPDAEFLRHMTAHVVEELGWE